jgi:predicted RNA-binding protein with PIN domain
MAPDDQAARVLQPAGTADLPVLAELPPTLRKRIAKLSAQALGTLPQESVPPSLRRAAAFAPARRAKLAGDRIAALAEVDEAFRVALADQVRVLMPASVATLEWDAEESTDADVAAAAYLVRPTGWEGLVNAACEAIEHGVQAAQSAAPDGDRRLVAALESARAETQAVRDRLRQQIDKLKSDNASLRQTLGVTRRELRSAGEREAAYEAAVAETQRAAVSSTRDSEAEARRLRHRVSELEMRLAGLLGQARDDRDRRSMRLRLLLDTVTEATAGLRRELALPPVERLPADTLPARTPSSSDSSSSVRRGLALNDSDALRRLLELPRVHLVVDGYNVSKTAWPATPLEDQRTLLIGKVSALVAGRGAETTVVFDAADADEVPALPVPKLIRVLFSAPGVIADDLIRQLVAQEPPGRPVVVVSSDRELADSVARRGAHTVASEALLAAFRP